MEALAEQTWDAVICGTGLQQSLLALALSRSGKQILHLDPNEYYGGHEAALTLQEVDEWVDRLRRWEGEDQAEGKEGGERQGARGKPYTQKRESVFSSASVMRPESDDGASTSLSASRAYALSLSPFIVHTRSALISQLVSSRAYRQLEFLAVGSFYILQPTSSEAAASAPASASPGAAPDTTHTGTDRPVLTPIPSTRESIFSTTLIDRAAKRALMKLITFVLKHIEGEQVDRWQSRADESFTSFLESDFRLDAELRALVMSLTLSLEPDKITVRDGLTAVYRHLTSMGVFGPGFAAVYPKYGGGSEVAQVACRAGAVGGGVYMLGTGVAGTRTLAVDDSDDGAKMEVELQNAGVKVKTRKLIRESEIAVAPFATTEPPGVKVSRLAAVINAPLDSVFEPVVEDTPNPGVAVIAVPPGSVVDAKGEQSEYPVFAFAHSSETGECPPGQSILYFATLSTPESSSILDNALSSVLAALAADKHEGGASSEQAPRAIYRLRYEQTHLTSGSGTYVDGTFSFPSLPPDLTFSDITLDTVKAAWAEVVGPAAVEMEAEYMKFEDREGMVDDDDKGAAY